MLFILSRMASNVPLMGAAVHQFKYKGRIIIPLPANAYFSSWSSLGMGSCFLNSGNAFISLFGETSPLGMVAASSSSTPKEFHVYRNHGKVTLYCSSPKLNELM
ncbi:hypothetical protein AMTRI_Chr08g168900 [Amborella trichopoda]